jgi:hypothetical protein
MSLCSIQQTKRILRCVASGPGRPNLHRNGCSFFPRGSSCLRPRPFACPCRIRASGGPFSEAGQIFSKTARHRVPSELGGLVRDGASAGSLPAKARHGERELVGRLLIAEIAVALPGHEIPGIFHRPSPSPVLIGRRAGVAVIGGMSVVSHRAA